MTTQEIKTLINTTLADIGNQAPWGRALNKILNGLVDLSSDQTNTLDLSNVVIGETRGMTVDGTMENIANTLNITKEEVNNLFHGKYTQVCPRWEEDNIHYVIHCFLNEVSEEYSDSEREIRAVEYYDGVHYFRMRMRRIGDFMEDNYVFSIGQDMG